MANPLSSEELSYFQRGRRRVTSTYSLGRQQNEYQRGVAAQQYAQTKGGLIDQFAQMRNRIPGSFINRGLINSGLYAQGLGDYAKQRNMALGNLYNTWDKQQAGFNLANTQLGAVKTNSLADLEEQKRARISALAAALGG